MHPTAVLPHYSKPDVSSAKEQCLFHLQNRNADTSKFDKEFTMEQPTLTTVHGQLSSKDE
jgi:hypothetical protein